MTEPAIPDVTPGDPAIPAPLIALRVRLGNAIGALTAIRDEREDDDSEVDRLNGKLEGVRLALSYLAEEISLDQRTADVVRQAVTPVPLVVDQVAIDLTNWRLLDDAARDGLKNHFLQRVRVASDGDPGILLAEWSREVLVIEPEEGSDDEMVHFRLSGHAHTVDGEPVRHSIGAGPEVAEG